MARILLAVHQIGIRVLHKRLEPLPARIDLHESYELYSVLDTFIHLKGNNFR